MKHPNCKIIVFYFIWLFILSGCPISVLDGVLIAVKDEIDCMPYPTTGYHLLYLYLKLQLKSDLSYFLFHFVTGGTKWLQRFRTCREDASCVKNLRLCGAILVGKTNMHELGAGTSGINPHYGY